MQRGKEDRNAMLLRAYQRSKKRKPSQAGRGISRDEKSKEGRKGGDTRGTREGAKAPRASKKVHDKPSSPASRPRASHQHPRDAEK